jgi:excisionase family DNA binding protein
MTTPAVRRGPVLAVEVLTVQEAAASLRISRGLAFAAVRDGSLSSVAIGPRILIPRRQLKTGSERRDAGGPEHRDARRSWPR